MWVEHGNEARMLTVPMLLHGLFILHIHTCVHIIAVLPKPSWVTTKMPKTTGVRDSRDYTTLNPDIDESTKTGTEDSGFEEWKQHVHQPCAPSPKGTHRTCA